VSVDLAKRIAKVIGVGMEEFLGEVEKARRAKVESMGRTK